MTKIEFNENLKNLAKKDKKTMDTVAKILKLILGSGINKTIGNVLEQLDTLNDSQRTYVYEQALREFNKSNEEIVDVGDVRSEKSISKEEQAENLSGLIELDEDFDLSKNKLAEGPAIAKFFEDYGETELVSRLVNYWIDEKQPGLNRREVIGNYMLNGEDELFPNSIVNKSSLQEEEIPLDKFNSFKTSMLSRKIETLISSKNPKLTPEKMRVLNEEIEELNRIKGENKNLIDYFYDIRYGASDNKYAKNKRDLSLIYSTFFGNTIEIKKGLSREDLNTKVKDYFIQWPEEYSKGVEAIENLPLETAYKESKMSDLEVVEEYLSLSFEEKIDSKNFKKKDIIERIVALKNSEKSNLSSLTEKQVSEIQKIMDKKAEEDVLIEESIEYLDLCTAEAEKKKLGDFDMAKVFKDQNEFNALFKKYARVNQELSKNKMQGRSFLVDMQRGSVQKNTMKGVLIKSLYFIHKNYENVLPEDEYIKQVELVKKSLNGGKGYDFTNIMKYEAKISEDASSSKKLGNIKNETEKFFFKMTDYNKDLMLKNASEMNQHFEDMELDKNHFVEDVLLLKENENTNGKSLKENLGIREDSVEKEINDYIVEYQKSNPKDSSAFVNELVSLKAEDEVIEGLKYVRGDISTNLTESSKKEKLIELQKNYALMRKRPKRNKANIVEDYVRNLDVGKKREIIKNMLLFMNVEKPEVEIAHYKLNDEENSYNEKLTDHIDSFLKEDPKNIEKVMGQLASENNEDIRYTSNPIKSINISDVFNGLSDEMNENIKEAKQVEKDNEEAFNLRGLSYITQNNYTFKLGHKNAMSKYGRGEFARNKELNDLIGLRILTSSSVTNFEEKDMEFMNISAYDNEDVPYLDRLTMNIINKDYKERQEYVKRISSDENSKEWAELKEKFIEEGNNVEDFNKEVVESMLLKMAEGEGLEDDFKRIINNIYISKRDKFLEENKEYIKKAEINSKRMYTAALYEKLKDNNDYSEKERVFMNNESFSMKEESEKEIKKIDKDYFEENNNQSETISMILEILYKDELFKSLSEDEREDLTKQVKEIMGQAPEKIKEKTSMTQIEKLQAALGRKRSDPTLEEMIQVCKANNKKPSKASTNNKTI